MVVGKKKMKGQKKKKKKKKTKTAALFQRLFWECFFFN